MIFINLLPAELRIKEKRKLRIPYRPIGAGVFFIFVVFAIYHLFLYVRIREEHRTLTQQWNAIQSKSVQADLLEQELGVTIFAEVDFYDDFVDPPLETARVLNLISTLIPNGAWLTEVKFARNKKELELFLNGFSESGGKSSRLIEIQQFANAIKDQVEAHLGPLTQANPNVKKTVKTMVTTSSQNRDGEKGEITQFNATIRTEGFSETAT
ncbi:MAG: hypothetical protein HY584_05655 [Candidatus Omnitrophica bacterium]|nr:hypothetical protein [Candidatus Omnitrophota bacterium]